MSKQEDWEHHEQASLFNWVEWNLHLYPELQYLHAIPNGGKRTIYTARKMKEEGVKAGVPDIFLPVPRDGYCGYYIELKAWYYNDLGRRTGHGSPHAGQVQWIKALQKLGYRADVLIGWEAARDALIEYLGGDREPAPPSFWEDDR